MALDRFASAGRSRIGRGRPAGHESRRNRGAMFATIGIMGVKEPFWPIPSAYFTGAGVAVGIAFINSVGSLGGFCGPYMIGWAKRVTNSFSGGLYALAAMCVGGAIVT